MADNVGTDVGYALVVGWALDRAAETGGQLAAPLARRVVGEVPDDVADALVEGAASGSNRYIQAVINKVDKAVAESSEMNQVFATLESVGFDIVKKVFFSFFVISRTRISCGLSDAGSRWPEL